VAVWLCKPIGVTINHRCLLLPASFYALMSLQTIVTNDVMLCGCSKAHRRTAAYYGPHKRSDAQHFLSESLFCLSVRPSVTAREIRLNFSV